jgi:predicted phage terminase large subunit-like protein
VLKPLLFRPYHQAASSPLTNEQEALKEACRYNYPLFVKEFGEEYVWGEPSELHNYFTDSEADPFARGRLEATAAPRGHAKTSHRVIVKTAHAILYGYEPYTLILSFNKTNAVAKLKDIRAFLQSEKIVSVFGIVVPKNAGQESFETTNGCRLEAMGRGGKVRGLKFGAYRPTRLVFDDVEDLEGTRTVEQREKTFQWFSKDVMPSVQKGGKYLANVDFVGTILHDESLLAKQLQTSGWTSRKFKALLEWPKNTALWDDWKAIYCNLHDKDAVKKAKAFYEANEAAMNEGANVLWPEGDPLYGIQEFIIQYGRAAFQSEKQNEPYDPDKQLLDPDACERFTVYWPHSPQWPQRLNGERFAIVCNRTKKAIRASELTFFVALDPALGKTATSDYAATVVCAQDLSGYIYVLDCRLKREAPTHYIGATYQLAAKWGFDTLNLEIQGFQELLKQPFAEVGKLYPDTPLKIYGMKQHVNKQARIQTLEPYFSAGWIKFNNDVEPELLNQLRLFPTGHDDGADALQMAVSKCRRIRGSVSSGSTQGERIL